MSLTVKYNDELGIIQSVLYDTVTTGELRMVTIQCIALAKQNNTNRFIPDSTQADFKTSIIALFDLPK